MASLHWIKGLNEGATLPLAGEKIVLGRSAECQLVINVPAISREHAVFKVINGQFWIEDLKSRNGTTVNDLTMKWEGDEWIVLGRNGARVHAPHIKGKMQLQGNDHVKICDNVFQFLDGRPPLPVDLRKGDGLLGVGMEQEDDASSTVEATLGPGSQRLLDAQPAEKLAMLVDLAMELAKTPSQDKLLPKIMDNLFQVFKQADRGFIIFRDHATSQHVPKAVKVRRGSDDAARWSRTIVNRCLDTGNAFLSEDASAEKGMDLSKSIADCKIRSVMCVPLMAVAEPSSDRLAFGVIQLDTQDRHKKFNSDDLRLLMAVASLAGTALDSAKLQELQIVRAAMERELDTAQKVQLSFLPKKTPQLSGYQFYAHYEAAKEVGGDYYDFIPLRDGHYAVMLGDVAGKGVPAALLMAKVSCEARFCLLTEPNLGAAISRLNELMQEAGMLDKFVTLAAGLLDPATHTVQFVNAGQMPPLVYRKASGAWAEGTTRAHAGLPLGVADKYDYQVATISLDPGDCVMVFSDGVTDAYNKAGKEFHMEGVHATLKTGPFNAPALGERLITAVKLHAMGCKQHDDISVVCFGRTV